MGFVDGPAQRSTGAKWSGKVAWAFLSVFAVVLVTAVAVALTAFAPSPTSDVATTSPAGSRTTAVAEVAAAVASEDSSIGADAVTDTIVASGPSVEYSSVEIEFVRLVNEYRGSNGLETLLISDVLTVACDRHSSDMATYGFMDHLTGYRDMPNGDLVPMEGKSSDYFATGTDPAERMIACGYDYATTMGENLAAGYDSAAGALEGFKASPTHNAILLSDDFKVMGISLVYQDGSDYGYYWTTDFGGHVDTTAHSAALTLVTEN